VGVSELDTEPTLDDGKDVDVRGREPEGVDRLTVLSHPDHFESRVAVDRADVPRGPVTDPRAVPFQSTDHLGARRMLNPPESV